MSMDPTFSSLKTFKQPIDLNLQQNRQLQSTLSYDRHSPPQRNSVKSSKKDLKQSQTSSAMMQRLTSNEESSNDTMTELISIPTFSNRNSTKRDRRFSDMKTTLEGHDHTSTDRRNSASQLHIGHLIQHAFRNPKHNNKTNTKDESNPIEPISTNSYSSPSSHFNDTMTTKTEPPFTLKPTTTSTNGTRLVTSNNDEPSSATIHNEQINLSSFVFDESIGEPKSAESLLLSIQGPISVSKTYYDEYYDVFHINYIGELEQEGPFLASIRCNPSKTSTPDIFEVQAIVRTSFRNCKISETINGKTEHNITTPLFNKAHLPSSMFVEIIGDPKANEKIYLFDKADDERYNYKIGIIYQRSNQHNEYEIFSNAPLSKDMTDFLEIISKRVPLKNFPKYRGDLDAKDDLHGEHSYHTEYENHEIMFNIAPLIPSTNANGQFIERKSLVGNAFVIIVFQEPGAKFSPDLISGKVTQVYIIVQPAHYKGELYYKISTWRRSDIKLPIDPPVGIYKNDDSFQKYFLTLILNYLNAAIESSSLRSFVYDQRIRLKYEELKKLAETFTFTPLFNFTTEFDNIYNPFDPSTNSRHHSFTSNTTTASTEGGHISPTRTSPVTGKKKGFSRIFSVFSGRSGSISVTTTSQNHIKLDSTPSGSLTQQDLNPSLTQHVNSTSKDNMKRLLSTKSNNAHNPSARASIPQVAPLITVHPSTPAGGLLNPFVQNKTPSRPPSIIVKDHDLTQSSNGTESEEESI